MFMVQSNPGKMKFSETRKKEIMYPLTIEKRII